VASRSSSDPVAGARGATAAGVTAMAPTAPNPYGLFGLEPRFDLAPASLEARFRERSRELHPDRNPSAAPAERAQAMIRTRALNDAYQILRRPERRAEHLLARAGLVIGDHERLDPRFLAEILELREQLAEARLDRRLDEVARLEASMRARHATHLAALAPLFAIGDADALAAIKQHLITLRYVGRYLEECEAALSD